MDKSVNRIKSIYMLTKRKHDFEMKRNTAKAKRLSEAVKKTKKTDYNLTPLHGCRYKLDRNITARHLDCIQEFFGLHQHIQDIEQSDTIKTLVQIKKFCCVTTYFSLV